METNIRISFLLGWFVFHTQGTGSSFFLAFHSSSYHSNVSRGNPLAGPAVLNQNTSSELAVKVAKHDTSRAAIQENCEPGGDWFIGVIV